MAWMPAARLRARIPELLELVGLTPFRRKQLRTFSKGMLQRIGLAQALLNEPDLIFLDEPTSGLDPVGRLLVRDIIREQRARGATVFLNSHLLSEVEITCDRVAFIKHGRVLEMLELNAAATGERAVEISIAGEAEPRRYTAACEDAIPDIVAGLVHQGARITSVVAHRPSLEDLFLRIVGTDGGL